MCRFLDKDGHCAFHSDDEVKEYCVAGPCPDMQTYNELIDALRNCSSPIIGSCAKCVYKGPDCKWNMMIDAADAIERLMAEVDRKDKALQAWSKTWEQTKNKLIMNICQHCDSVLVGCEGFPVIGEVKGVFDDGDN